MTKKEKERIFNDYEICNGINKAKDRMWIAANHLEEQGLLKDAETLRKMIYRLEAFQTKYDEHRL